MSKNKIRTMEEFASASGLSRPTVSKYFDNPENVKPSTRTKIEKAIRDYDYQPNIFAVSMNKRQPKNIGVIVPHVADPFYAEIVRQIEMRCLAEGYWAIVISSHGERKLEARAMRTLMSLKLAGAVMAPLGFETDTKLLTKVADTMPMVFLDSRIDNCHPFVGTDNQKSIGNIVEYLHRTGEHPCFMEMPAVNQNALERRDAYTQTMERIGLEPIVLPIKAKSWNFEELGYEAAGRIIDGGGFPTRAVLCANDRIAFGVISAAFARRRYVGSHEGCDLRVAGHDDHPISRFSCPALTTVAQEYERIAHYGLDMLFARIKAQSNHIVGAPEHIKLDSKLIIRESA